MYGKISPTIISQKLGVGICNPAPDWIDGLQDDFEEEILVYNHDIKTYKRDGIDTKQFAGRYNLDQIVNQLGWQEIGKSAKQIIAEHLIEIQVTDFKNSML